MRWFRFTAQGSESINRSTDDCHEQSTYTGPQFQFCAFNGEVEVIIKIGKWLLLALLIAVAAVAVILGMGAQLSLDRDRDFTRAFEALPLFTPESADGLVRIEAGGLTFRARIAGFGGGDPARPTVVLLHGFPVSSAMWTPLIEQLDRAGYRVLAFDQRGYSPGARPAAVSEYTMEKLTGDVIAVTDAAGIDRFHLVGHDWGSVVGWNTVMGNPQRIISWTGLSIAHPYAFGEALREDPDQQARSRYFALFSAPWLPQTLFAFDDFRMLRGFYSALPAAERDEYLALFAEPGALSSALSWYRAMSLSQAPPTRLNPTITTPTLFIWGNRDGAAGPYAVRAQARYINGPYQMLELDAGHWVVAEYPDRIGAALLQHLHSYPGEALL